MTFVAEHKLRIVADKIVAISNDRLDDEYVKTPYAREGVARALARIPQDAADNDSVRFPASLRFLVR